MSVLTAAYFHDEAAAFAKLEAVLWPNGPVCPHCGSADKIYVLKGVRSKPSKKNPEGIERHGLKKCGACRKQFTVRVGTVFESSHIPLHKWFQAVHLLCSSKKGISSHQLHRVLEITYEAAWFMSHRIREAMRSGDLAPMGGAGGSGVGEADGAGVADASGEGVGACPSPPEQAAKSPKAAMPNPNPASLTFRTIPLSNGAQASFTRPWRPGSARLGEGHTGGCALDALDCADVLADDGGHIGEVRDLDHGDDVIGPHHLVDLGDAVDRSELFVDINGLCRVDDDEDEGFDHDRSSSCRGATLPAA